MFSRSLTHKKTLGLFVSHTLLHRRGTLRVWKKRCDRNIII